MEFAPARGDLGEAVWCGQAAIIPGAPAFSE